MSERGAFKGRASELRYLTETLAICIVTGVVCYTAMALLVGDLR